MMGELSKKILQKVFQEYDTMCRNELSDKQVQMLHANFRTGGISLPQVVASMKYACATDHCQDSELLDLLQEMDRRYYLMQDFRAKFSQLEFSDMDTITEADAKSMVQMVQGKHFSQKEWTKFLNTRAVPGSGVCFEDIEVMLCDVPSRYKLGKEENMQADHMRRQKLLEEEAKRLRNEKENERQKDIKYFLETERQRREEERRRLMLEKDEKRNRGDERIYLEEEKVLKRLKELEEKQKEEKERRKKEDETLYKDAEELAKKATQDEKDLEADIIKREKDDPKLVELKKRKNKFKNTKLRFNLQVAIKVRDKLQLDNSITEFKNEKIEDIGMDLVKAERLLKELESKENLEKAITKREKHEIKNAIEMVKRYGFEVQLAKEVSKANQLLIRLRQLERIRHEIMELKQSTVAEIRSYQSPPLAVHTVMIVTFLLLGYKETETKIWKAVQALAGRTGKESFVCRCLEVKPENIPVSAAKRARTLLEKFKLDEVIDISAGAATFYVWSTTMIEESHMAYKEQEEQKRLKSQIHMI